MTDKTLTMRFGQGRILNWVVADNGVWYICLYRFTKAQAVVEKQRQVANPEETIEPPTPHVALGYLTREDAYRVFVAMFGEVEAQQHFAAADAELQEGKS